MLFEMLLIEKEPKWLTTSSSVLSVQWNIVQPLTNLIFSEYLII